MQDVVSYLKTRRPNTHINSHGKHAAGLCCIWSRSTYNYVIKKHRMWHFRTLLYNNFKADYADI